MKPRLPLVLLAAALLGGCATKDYVNEQIAGVNQRMDGQQADANARFGQAAGQYQGLDSRLNSQQAALDGASRTAQEALERASAAGKLATGKVLYETALTSRIGFDFDGSALNAAARQALDDFAAQIKAENRNVYIEIQGHTDSSGSAATNLRIGEQRAEAVRRYLTIQHGFALHRMNAISYGETAPVADNGTRAGRAENRRVTLVVLQ
jgi:outer membrane protein OmpA-like peptidoglycan-associated protein